jgi:hypothetical protein
MSNFIVSKDVLFEGLDLSRPRWVVEKEKLNAKFPGFTFYGSNGEISSVTGYLHTNYGNSYYVKISISSSYPYDLPKVSLPYTIIESSCPHHFTNDNICLMKLEQWNTTFSLAFLVTKVALWLNKYDYWKRHNRWPGNQQAH